MPEDPPTSEFVTQLTRFQPDIWAYLLALMPGHPDVADVLQKTNLVLWNKRDVFMPGTNFRAWALTVARYESLAHLKSQCRSPHFVFDGEMLDLLAEEGGEILEPADSRLTALESCLTQLRSQDRELIEHRYFREGGLEEFARRCGRSVSSLSVTLFRLRSVLRRCVSEKLQAEGGVP